MLRLTLTELEDAVRAADPAAFLVLPRVLRRVVKHDRRLGGFGLKVPHRKSYVIASGPLLEIVEKAELGLAEGDALPERVVLLARPHPQVLSDTPAGVVLTRCWRLLFHARIHAALEDRIAWGRLSPAVARERILQIGTAKFDEIRAVLGQEDFLLPPVGAESTYVEFVAVYLELRHFAVSLLPRYFPGLDNLEAIDELIRQDVDAEGLFRATRPSGAPEPWDQGEADELADAPPGAEPLQPAFALPPLSPSAAKYRALMRKSQRPALLGNVVRTAICRARAVRHAPAEFVDRTRAALKMDVYRLIRRLQAALGIDDASPQPWQESLFALVGQTPRGIWTVEARLLYDLQKVCVDHEREIYTVDLAEWALSWGRRPIKRQLPNQRDVLMLKHLRSAARRLAVVRISDAQRRQLALLVHEAGRRVEARLRQRLRPQITAALDEVGLIPQNLPERLARKKLVEELLDQIVERGFLTMGDLRDAISRNNLKLPDLSEPLDFLRGDRLLRADRRLAAVLDGVYRGGEFYSRWMQRLSALGFGTAAGRFVTRFAAVPFGGAYVALAGVREVWEIVVGAEQPPLDSAAAAVAEGLHFTSPLIVLVLGLFLLGLVNSAAFRRIVARLFRTSYDVFRALVVGPIRWVAQWPLLQQILHSRAFTAALRFLVKPLVWTGVAWSLLPGDVRNLETSARTFVLIFLTVTLLFNSRLGRTLEEVVADGIVQGWHRFGLRVVTGLFWLVADVSRRVLATIERLMYAVDEWLRFKSGEGNLSLATKAVVGLLWFFVSYVLRFAVNVLIEPQINPIKHFPVVTVSHKLLLPLIPHFTGVLVGVGMEKALAGLTAGAVITSIPGFFGFLVWELTENWRLYAANRRPNLVPAPIGPHGETMPRLLKMGFHSGTVAKRFAKLRRAERRARAGGSWHAVHKHLRFLHHLELSLRRYVEREFLELFAQSDCWQGPAIVLKEIRLSTNSVRLAIACPELGDTSLSVALEVESGWLTAGVTDPGWTEQLLSHQRHALATALMGLYKTAGVDLVREQIEDQFAPHLPRYELSAAGLVLWPENDWDVEALYDLREGPWIAPQFVRGLARRSLPTLARGQLVFGEVPAPWDRWVAAWNQESAGQTRPQEFLVPVRVLP